MDELIYAVATALAKAIRTEVSARSIVTRCAIHPRIVVLPPFLNEWCEVSAAYRSTTGNPAQ